MVGPRLKTFLWPALLLACAVPAQAVPPSAAPPAPRFSAPSATLTLVPSGGAACTLRWAGETLGQSTLLDRSVILISERVREVGGPQALDERNIPLFRVEAPADAPWSCLAPTLDTIARAGFAFVALRPAGAGDAPDEIAHFLFPELDGEAEPSAILRFDAEGGARWNGEAVDPEGLRARLATLGEARARLGTGAPHNQFVAVPEPGTSFATLLALLHNAAGLGMDTVVSRCRASDGPAGNDALDGVRC